VSAWRVTVRTGPRVEKVRAASVEEALDALEAQTRAAATAEGRRGMLDLRYRRFEPSEQVVIRAELRGPGRWRPAVQAGVDVRGDGGVQPWTGGLRREPLPLLDGEDPFAALRRAVTAGA
jgi:hypothetical protein